MAKKTVLIVDDDPDIVLANRLVLESAGYAVEEAASGEECLAKMRAHLPDLVLMDVMMANPLDGYHTTQQISDDPQLRRVPILMVSSITTSQYAAAFPTDQFLDIREFISKPVEPEVLLTKINQHIL
ncbi:MAG TPA: response regulator [Anaerolineae bacterium]|nr:response regulator [Anaerolineae bacterium]HQK14859.1 response regulator [Anaerolineae bacterium]